MDGATLESLLKALAASPDNVELRMIAIRGLRAAGRSAEARDLVGDRRPSELSSAEDRCAVAELLIDCDEPERALDWADAEIGRGQLCRARAHLALGDRDAARDAYRAAIAANPTLEDMDLKTALASEERVYPPGDGGDGPRLRVIANDDTDDDELTRLLAPSEEIVTFGDVGGLLDIKTQIRKRIITPFQKPALFQRFKKRVGGGILMYGPPGCGKTLLARATAGECDAAFFAITISDVLDMYIGESERKLHALFEKARASTPAVVFFDEIEALGGKRQFHREGTASKLVSQFLSEMDGFAQNNQGVLILGATNTPWAVDPAFRRPGRFDRVLFVPPPDRNARAEILRILLADRPHDPDLPLSQIARKTGGFSGADLGNVVETAADHAIEASLEAGDEVPINREHLHAALGEVKPTTVEWLTTARNHARYANEGGQYDDVLEFLKRHGK
jgi:AAA+ superfamily predicted ATPase